MTVEGLVVLGLTKGFSGSGTVLDQVDLDVPSGTSLVLLGPSGTGKTTLLRIIAGLDRPDCGHVRLGGRTLCDESSFVAPEKRRIGMVFQDWALFEHLSVARNVGFGLPRAERRCSERIDEVLALVGMTDFADRSIRTLSGGQQQRVALARALAPRPQALLLDEPFSNLDAALRGTVRSEVRDLLNELGVTAVYVTHDREEAFVLGDQVAVLDGGRILQAGSPVELYDRPANRFVASFVGDANFIDAQIRSDSDDVDHQDHRPLDLEMGLALTALGDVRVPLDAPTLDGRQVQVLVRPEQLLLEPADDAPSSAEARTCAKVLACEFLGHSTRYQLDWRGQRLVARENSRPRFAEGAVVELRVVDEVLAAFDT